MIQSAAQKPDSKAKAWEDQKPCGSPWAVTSRSGKAKKGMFWAKFPVTQLLYLASGGCRKRWFQLGAGSGNRKIKQAMVTLGCPPLCVPCFAGVRALRCQVGCYYEWGETWRLVVALGPCWRGQMPSPLCTGLAQTLLTAPCPSAGSHPQPHISILWRKAGLCFKSSLPSSAPGGRAGDPITASLSPPPGWGSLRALTQNLGLQHDRLKNLWGLCPRNQIFCLINP